MRNMLVYKSKTQNFMHHNIVKSTRISLMKLFFGKIMVRNLTNVGSIAMMHLLLFGYILMKMEIFVE